jgi:hypothetical protein
VKWDGGDGKVLLHQPVFPQLGHQHTSEMEFTLTKEWSLLLHAIQSLFQSRILKKNALLSGLKILTKNPRNKKP